MGERASRGRCRWAVRWMESGSRAVQRGSQSSDCSKARIRIADDEGWSAIETREDVVTDKT